MKLPQNSILVFGILIRVAFLIIGNRLDQRMQWNLSYTDVDYLVFSDAAKYFLAGGSPYDRTTYRYTPIMAYLVIPNHLLHPIFGKVLFVIIDLLCSLLLRSLLKMQHPIKALTPYIPWLDFMFLFNPMTIVLSTRGSSDTIVLLLVLLCLWLLLKEQYLLGGMMFGFSVHFKIYPIIYGWPIILFIDSS
jgi:phosphatidylinositol glycan class M